MTKPREFAFADATRELDQGIAGADALRAEQLGQLFTVRRAKGVALKREQARLAQKLGKSHPRVLALTGHLQVNAGMQRDLSLEATRAATELPTVDEKTWALLGVVRDKELRGLPGLTVALFDEKGIWVQQLGHSCTRDDGQFRLETPNLSELPGSVFVHVSNADQRKLLADDIALTPAGGKIDYRELIVTDVQRPCPPPAGDRAPSNPSPSPNPNPNPNPTAGTGAGSPPKADPSPAPKRWTLRGTVTDSAGKGVAGLTVSVFDRDLFFDDRLGQTPTDEHGNYELVYRAEQFGDLVELEPDLYLKVLNERGETLYTTKGAVRWEAGRTEVIDVKLSKQ